MINPAKTVTEIQTAPIGDGQHIEIKLITSENSEIHLSFDKDTVAKFIKDITEAAIVAAKVRTRGIPIALEAGTPSILLNKIDVSHVGIAEGSDGSLHLILRFLDFDLSYQIDHRNLRSIAVSLVEALKALQHR
jgi:hypothetical protein